MAPLLRKKTAIVTGGSRGIGRSIVSRFLSDQFNVVSCGRGPRPRDMPTEVVWVQADVSSSSEAGRILAAAEHSFGTVDVLVNNAGVQLEKPVSETSDEDWDHVMGINARGTFNMCRAVLPGMIETGGGIVNMSSTSSVAADRSMAIYNASKSFVDGLTRSIAIDHGPKVRCNAVRPGWIMTDMAAAAFALAQDPERARNAALSRHAAGQFGLPEDIANIVAWLVSDQSQFVTGQSFTSDGGLTAASPLQPGLF